MAKTYLCANDGCPLGSVHHHGRFTGGMTAEQKHLVTGQPVESLVKGADYGQGICPNCGKPGIDADSPEARKLEEALA